MLACSRPWVAGIRARASRPATISRCGASKQPDRMASYIFRASSTTLATVPRISSTQPPMLTSKPDTWHSRTICSAAESQRMRALRLTATGFVIGCPSRARWSASSFPPEMGCRCCANASSPFCGGRPTRTTRSSSSTTAPTSAKRWITSPRCRRMNASRSFATTGRSTIPRSTTALARARRLYCPRQQRHRGHQPGLAGRNAGTGNAPRSRCSRCKTSVFGRHRSARRCHPRPQRRRGSYPPRAAKARSGLSGSSSSRPIPFCRHGCLPRRQKIALYRNRRPQRSVSARRFQRHRFCLRIRSAGYRIIWTPFAELYHHESATRGEDNTPEKAALGWRGCVHAATLGRLHGGRSGL